MKRLLILTGLIIGLSANAQWIYFTTNLVNAQSNVIVSTVTNGDKWFVDSVSVYNASNNFPALLNLYDNYVGSNWFAAAAYMTSIMRQTNYSNVVTLANGLTSTNYDVGWQVATGVVAAAQHTIPASASFAVPGWSAQTITLGMPFTKGVAFACSEASNVVITIRYRPWW